MHSCNSVKFNNPKNKQKITLKNSIVTCLFGQNHEIFMFYDMIYDGGEPHCGD